MGVWGQAWQSHTEGSVRPGLDLPAHHDSGPALAPASLVSRFPDLTRPGVTAGTLESQSLSPAERYLEGAWPVSPLP